MIKDRLHSSYTDQNKIHFTLVHFPINTQSNHKCLINQVHDNKVLIIIRFVIQTCQSIFQVPEQRSSNTMTKHVRHRYPVIWPWRTPGSGPRYQNNNKPAQHGKQCNQTEFRRLFCLPIVVSLGSALSPRGSGTQACRSTHPPRCIPRRQP